MRFRNGVPPSDHFFIDDEESSLHFHDLYDRTYDRPWKVIDPIQTKLLIWKIKSNRKKHIIVASVLTSKYLPFLRLSNLQQIYTLFFSSILCKDFPFNRIPLLTNKNFWKDLRQFARQYVAAEGRSWASKCEETFGKHSIRFWERKGKQEYSAAGAKNWISCVWKTMNDVDGLLTTQKNFATRKNRVKGIKMKVKGSSFPASQIESSWSCFCVRIVVFSSRCLWLQSNSKFAVLNCPLGVQNIHSFFKPYPHLKHWCEKVWSNDGFTFCLHWLLKKQSKIFTLKVQFFDHKNDFTEPAIQPTY